MFTLITRNTVEIDESMKLVDQYQRIECVNKLCTINLITWKLNS